uniref:Uncharacterized protein n=1 Tax=Monodelphis domestica TaxID=13616 RepID=A0A5F8HAR5_MONDO
MLSRLALHAAGALALELKNMAPLAPGVLQATRIFHTASPHLAPLPPLSEHGGKKVSTNCPLTLCLHSLKYLRACLMHNFFVAGMIKSELNSYLRKMRYT